MSNYAKVSVANDPRTELHDQLGLTGAEISINHLPQGAGIPFVHSHKTNEEIYIILSGKGKAVIDGETVELAEGDLVRISPEERGSSLRLTIQNSVMHASRSRQVLLMPIPQLMQ